MLYRYEQLSPSHFENLIAYLCQELFGVGATVYSEGKDRGIDIMFSGCAQLYPSERDPWKGKVVIQVKHTRDGNASMSQPEFSGDKPSSTISQEIQKIKKLRKNGDLTHYMLVSNRRITAGASRDIVNRIAKDAEIPDENIGILGKEQIEMYIIKFPDVPFLAGIDPVDFPLDISPDEIANIVRFLAQYKDEIFDIKPRNDFKPTERTSFDNKVKLNNMTSNYGNGLLKDLKNFKAIQDIINSDDEIQYLYESVTENFRAKITAHRKDYQNFDNVIEYIFNLCIEHDYDIKKHQRVFRQLLFFMFWYCDIGETNA